MCPYLQECEAAAQTAYDDVELGLCIRQHLGVQCTQAKQVANAFYNVYYVWTTITFYIYQMFLISGVAYYPYYENDVRVHNQMYILMRRPRSITDFEKKKYS